MAAAKARVGFREERGLTQAALAGALGISPSYVNQLESSQRPMTAAVLLRLASVFDADLHQFSAEDADRLVALLRGAPPDPAGGGGHARGRPVRDGTAPPLPARPRRQRDDHDPPRRQCGRVDRAVAAP